MTAKSQQIIQAFESLGLAPEQIAESFGMEVQFVKATLLQNSSGYRKASKNCPELEFTDSEAQEIKDIILDIARDSEDRHLQFKAAKFVYEDKKGYLEGGRLLKDIPESDMSFVAFNIRMQQALNSRERTKAIKEAREVEISSEPVTS